VDPDPHNLFGNLDPHLMKIRILIKVMLDLELDPIPHRFADDEPKCMENEPILAPFKGLSLYLEARIRIRIRVIGRIRIHIRVISRIRIRNQIRTRVISRFRIRINVMLIHNNAVQIGLQMISTFSKRSGSQLI
jgi:hypothetical protein